jgi:hypothetical protein
MLLFGFVAMIQAFGAGIAHSSSKCVFPASDGNDIGKPNHANIYGRISKKTNSTIIIKEIKTNKNIMIRLNQKTELYTVYGGDGPLNALRPGLIAWVWFEHCKKPAYKTPVAAMIWIISTDPNDQNQDGWDKPDYLK